MSKVRVYELAKELGVDSKVILAKAKEVGVSGRLAHSSSLESDEADQIRRAFIREAVGSLDKEVVTTRVDKATGVSEAVVEKRKGNVIRRRRADSDGTDAPAAEDNVFKSQKVEFAKEAESQKFVEEVVVDNTPEQISERLEEISVIEEAPVIAAVEELAVITDEVAAVAPAQIEVVKRAGPRILGKIELPQARVAVPGAQVRSGTLDVKGKVFGRPAVARGGGTVQAAVEDEVGAKKQFGKPGRKREFSRNDLVDYDGIEVRKAKADHRKGKHRSDDSDRADSEASTKARVNKVTVKIGDAITVGELARQMSVKSAQIIAKLMELGVMATINHSIDADTAQLIVEEFGCEVEKTSFDEAAILDLEADSQERLELRAPIVTVMGHVDHGKTSLLDYIRKATVAAKEHGGITQHIGAYQVTTPDKRKITFLDTPGHAAFTSMRARGAKITDLVILVVAADDGVMPQTIEAINHAKSAGVPIVVAVNKIDKGDANPDRVKQQLVERGLQPEDWGGDTMFFHVSALKGTGVQELLEGILLIAELAEFKADAGRRAKGAVIESRQDKGLGSVATVLVQTGTLRVGDLFVCGSEWGRVRTMTNDLGQRVKEAGPSTPIQITGLSGIAEAGDEFLVVESEQKAKTVSDDRKMRQMERDKLLSSGGPISLEEFAKRANNVAALELNVILKADVHGSLEAIRDALEKLSTAKVRVKVVHSAVGGVTESDVQLAIASNAIIVAFGVRAEVRAQAEAEGRGVEIRFYRIIYEVLDDVRKAMAGLLAPIKQESALGRVEVRETFSAPKIGVIAGCYVTDGMVKRGTMARLLRDSKVIYEGKLGSLRRFKDDVKEVQSGFECGISIENFNDVKVGDAMEIYEFKEVAQSLD
jgi:translation initiation factor IF-2